MLTPDYLLHVSEGAEAISARLHTDIVKRITRRIAARQNRGDEYLLTSADKWHIETLMDAGYLRDDIAADIAAATGRQLSEIKEAFEDAGVRSTTYDDKVYKAAGLEPLPFKQSPYMQRLMQRNYDATAGLWQNYTRTTANAAQQTFINAMDDIYTKVASGAMGYTQAYEEAINDLAANGVDLTTENGQTYVQYRHSRDTIETATLRCVRTGVSQMSAQVTEARMDEFGVDLVIVSSHMGARPEHAVWQGKIYSRSGTDKKYPNFVENTHYGSGDGLCGWNCRHQFSPYFEGMDNPFEQIDEKENEEVYDLTQKQRRAEREIRKTRRQAEVLTDYAQQLEDPEEKKRYYESADRAKKHLSKQIEGYNNFCEENNLRTLPERLRIARASRATGNTNLEGIKVKREQPKQKSTGAETHIIFKDGDDAERYFGEKPDRGLRRTDRELYNQKMEQYRQSQFGKFYDGLSGDQVSAIGQYSGDAYSGINGLLRGRVTEKMSDAWKMSIGRSLQEMATDITSAIETFDLQDGITVFRTCDSNVLNYLNLREGEIFTDSGFVSTSVIQEKVASGNIVMHINVPPGKGHGAWINPISGAEDKEYEFLLQRGSSFRVKKTYQRGDDTIVELDWIGAEPQPIEYASREHVLNVWKKEGIEYTEDQAQRI